MRSDDKDPCCDERAARFVMRGRVRDEGSLPRYVRWLSVGEPDPDAELRADAASLTDIVVETVLA